ncbi:hypothetical protein F2Q68_00027169 [Brassica cretica]|uniref:Uncharacterized protein n=1 Tax=Brassica cretica TaxID=69181 RepID=A0A8S9I7B8_BRACR|nr:hypothetical protein F2Q68_00027169 [Brassica cretica]
MRARVSSQILNRGSGCENGGENEGDNGREITGGENDNWRGFSRCWRSSNGPTKSPPSIRLKLPRCLIRWIKASLLNLPRPKVKGDQD